jgi:hypothetical protein
VYTSASRLLTVFLPQAEQVTVQLSSFVDPADLELLAMWMMESPAARAAQQADAEAGRHWMLTPWQLVTLVHAVEKPLSAPVLHVPSAGVPASGVTRNVGETFAVLAGTISNHAKSTGRLDVEARWKEPIDDLAQDAPSELDGHAHVGDFLLTASENACRIGRDDAATGVPVHRLRHEFRDTKHRWVRDPGRRPGEARRPRRRPAGGAAARRPAQGEGPRPARRPPGHHQGGHATRPGPCPPPPGPARRAGGEAGAALDLSLAFSPAQLAVLDKAVSAFLRPRGDPQQYVTHWGLDPIWGSPPVDPGPYVHQFPLRVAVGGGVSLSEAPGHTVTVVGHRPAFDPLRKLWYCDLQLNAGVSYFPFVRLALARYQPHSIAGQHLSKVVVPEWAQLVAPRTAALTRVSSFASVSLRGPAGYTENAEDLVTFLGGVDQLASLSRFAVAQVERLPANATTDLAWAAVGDEVRLDLSAANGLRDVVYTGRVPVPAKEKGQQLRLAVREYEIFRTDESEADDHLIRPPQGVEDVIRVRAVKYRLVYAGELAL